jgi:hypothetical protein
MIDVTTAFNLSWKAATIASLPCLTRSERKKDCADGSQRMPPASTTRHPKIGSSDRRLLAALIGISPDGVPVHVHDREIEEHIDGARLSGFRSSPS